MQSNLSSLVQFGMWCVIVVLAFVMQVAPFLLILTVFNIAVGVSSTTVLILIPAMLFAMLIAACAIAGRRRRLLPAPAVQGNSGEALRHTAPCMLPYMKRQRIF